MFEILVYLFENYSAFNACADADALTRKLAAAGFPKDEITDALAWLQGLERVTQDASLVNQATPGAFRVYAGFEVERLGSAAIGFLAFLESAGQLSATQREIAVLRRDVEAVRAQYRQGLIGAGEYNTRIAPLTRRADHLAQRAAQEQAAIQRYQGDAATGRRNGWNTAEIDRAVQSMSADNQRERAALDDVQRALSGRG